MISLKSDIKNKTLKHKLSLQNCYQSLMPEQALTIFLHLHLYQYTVKIITKTRLDINKHNNFVFLM